MAGAKPVFADIDPTKLTTSPSEVEKAITKKTKAMLWIYTVFSADMKILKEIASTHGLALVEDAAQAHGTTYEGKPSGAFADAACWSLYASKNMTTGEGGVVTTNDHQIAETLRMDKDGARKS